MSRNTFDQKLGFMESERWIEQMENELDPSLAQDMEILLKNSVRDRKRLERLWQTRNLIKKSDDVALPEDGRYYDVLHDKIIAAVDTASREDEVERSTGVVTDPTAKLSWTLAFISALARRWTVREYSRS